MNTIFYQLPRITKFLGGSTKLSQVKLYISLFFFYIVTRFFRQNFLFPLKCNFRGVTFVFHCGSLADIGVLEEIFAKQQYDWDFDTPSEEIKNILDLGAHGGETVVYYKILYPDAHIYAVEPDPDSFKRLKLNTRDFENVTVLQAAVSNQVGSAELHRSRSSLGNNIVFKRTDTVETVTVETYTLSALLKKLDIHQPFDLIKFDIEGAEDMVLRDQPLVQFGKKYIGEIHGDLMNMTPQDFLVCFRDTFLVTVTEPFSTPNRAFVQATAIES